MTHIIHEAFGSKSMWQLFFFGLFFYICALSPVCAIERVV
jgi:hypothetical protein